MIRLSLLGSLDLRASDGRQILSVLAQPKRVALLAYLAANRDFVRTLDTRCGSRSTRFEEASALAH
jgi:DNA-binding SARP family transcriptional activator